MHDPINGSLNTFIHVIGTQPVNASTDSMNV